MTNADAPSSLDRPQPDNYAAWRLPEFRYLLSGNAVAALASRALAVVIGYQVYELTSSPLSLGWLGLVEAIPSVSLALFAGHVADRRDRRQLTLLTQWGLVLCAVLFALLSTHLWALTRTAKLWGLLSVVFAAGIARGYNNPASSALEAQVIPAEIYVNAASWAGSVRQTCAIIGPALGGVAYAVVGPAKTYVGIAVLLAISCLCLAGIAPKPMPPVDESESIFQSIAIGLRFVFSRPVLVWSMALDLFAVLFGGAVALLPIFSRDILHVGARGLGLLSAAPSVGALVIALWATHRPPSKHAGSALLACVAGFGVSIIVFALSKNFLLSLLALAASGAFDAVSVIVRMSILRLMSPEHLRGRIAAVSWIFIGSSNEIGAFESGFAADWLGTIRSVWAGGIVTLLVVGATFFLAPELRRLDLSKTEQE